MCRQMPVRHVLGRVLKHVPQYMPKHMIKHVICFSSSFYWFLKCHLFKHPWDLQRTCAQLILISPYYITMKSTCYNH